MRRKLQLGLATAVAVVCAFVAFRFLDVDLPALGRGDAADPAPALAAAAMVDTSVCVVDAAGIPLSSELAETSGIARTRDGALWTHNDGAEARLYRIGEDGAVAQVVSLAGTRAVDIEDIDAGPCPQGAGECLWLADTGDNDGERPEVALLVVPAPPPGATSAPHTRLPFRWPDGPRDAEALAVLPSAEAVLVTKGRGAPIEVYAMALFDRAGAPSAPRTPRLIGRLAAEPRDRRARVGGAGASEDGAWIAVRTEVELAIFRADALLRGDLRPAIAQDLAPLRESQGEAVEIAADGRIWLTSEGERGTPTLARLRCTLPE